MDWAFLTALGGMQSFPAYGLLTLFFVLYFTGRIQSTAAALGEIERAQTQANKVVAEAREDRDARLESKNDEIARLTAAYNAEMARTREAERQWREAWRESQDIAAEVRSQNRDLIDSLYFVRKVFRALPTPEGGDET